MDTATASSAQSLRIPKPAAAPDCVAIGALEPSGTVVAQARLLGARIDTREISSDEGARQAIASEGLTFVFRYGVAVTFSARIYAVRSVDAAIMPFVLDPADIPESESAEVKFEPGKDDRIKADGQIVLSGTDHERLLLVAIVLSRSVVLSRDEILVSEAFDRSAPLVTDLQENGRAKLPITSVMKLVGNVLAARHRVIHSAQAGERPDVLWDHPELDRLYARLDAEYELGERAEVLERKFEVLGGFTSALLDIAQDKRAFRLESAIIVLIAFEIFLTLFKMAVG